MSQASKVMLVLVAGAFVSVGLGLSVGSASLSDDSLRDTILRLRASRVVVAFLVGSSLAVGGVVVQGLFNNPLASPSILGTTAGASFGGQLSLLFAQVLFSHEFPAWLDPEMFVPVGCFAGALVALLFLLLAARYYHDNVVLLLTGFLLSALFLSLGSFLTSLAQQTWELGRAVISFALGSLGGSGPRQVAVALPLACFGIGAAFLWARPLDLMLTGEAEARTLGVEVDQVRRWCIAWTGVLTAGAVAVGGNIGFVGLIVPHALRAWVGPGHRTLVPLSAVLGGAFVVLCDTLARGLPARSEVPLGVVTGVIGAPVFLLLLLRSRRAELYG